MTDQNQKRYSL